MKFNLTANHTNTACIRLRDVRKMKKTLMIALLIGIGAVAILPTPALAKKGDLYVNKDGSCDKGDSKKGYWCVESIAASAGSKAEKVDPTEPGVSATTRIYPESKPKPKPEPLVSLPR